MQRMSSWSLPYPCEPSFLFSVSHDVPPDSFTSILFTNLFLRMGFLFFIKFIYGFIYFFNPGIGSQENSWGSLIGYLSLLSEVQAKRGPHLKK